MRSRKRKRTREVEVDYIQVVFVGNVGNRVKREKFSENEDEVMFFDATVTRKVKGAEETVWLTVTLRGALLQHVGPLIRPGVRVFVVGALRANPYFTSTGEARAGLTVAASNVIVFSSNPEPAETVPY